MDIYEGSVALFTYDQKTTNTRNKKENKNIPKTKHIALWGSDNLEPNHVLKEGKKSGVWVGGMRVLRHAHYGNGFTFYKMEAKNDSDKLSKKILDISQVDDEIQRFWRRSKMDVFFLQRIYDLETFYMAFDEYILSKDYHKITRVKRIQAAHVRFELEDEKTHLIRHVYVKSDWSKLSIDNAAKVAYFDFMWSPDEIKEYCEKYKVKKFIRGSFFPQMMNNYYPEPDYLATYRNKWLQHCNTIPELKQRVIDQKLNFDYIVYVSDEYFERMYKHEWEDFTFEKRDEIRKTLYQEIDNHLAGKESVGRALKAPIFKNAHGEWVKGIQVETIDKKNSGNTDTYLTDATAGNQETLFALGVNPTIIGVGIPGGKGIGSGSGSDQRIAYYILSVQKNPDRIISSDPFYFISEWNDWPIEIKGTFAITTLTTLDKNPTGTENKI